MSLKPMFSGIVKRYDFLNHLLTWGFDTIWRNICAKNCKSGKIIVELCCGTGDLSLTLSKSNEPETLIIGLDFSKAMLQKAITKNKVIVVKNSNPNFILADAAHLPFRNNSINLICISFAFRNLIYKNPKANRFLKEVLWSLRNKGKLVFMETSQPKSIFIQSLYHFYLKKIVPVIGGHISSNKGAYSYLGTSASNFPSAEKVSNMLMVAGFQKVSYKKVTFGAVALHECIK
jgi:demethylmenaquinone methyltransferase/2-methoxy-6-polyprenyl-1,4-benzoquinol methylase